MDNIQNTELEGITKSLGSIENSIAAVQKEYADNKVTLKAAQDEIKKLGDQQVAFAKSLQDLQQKSDKLVDVTSSKPRTIGEMIVAEKAYQGFKDLHAANFEVKAAATSVAGNTIERTFIAEPLRRPGILTAPVQPLVIENLFPHVPVATSSVEYLKEGTYDNKAAITAEGAALPETTFTNPTLHSATVVNVGTFSKMTEQLINDAPAFAAYINTKLQYAMGQVIDNQLINGAGGATQLEGMLKEGNFTDVTATVQGEKPETLFDFALLAKAQLEAKYYTPQYFLLNPADWTKLCLIKDKQGRYILGGPQVNATPNLWGVPVIASATVPAGKFLLGNFTQAATVYDRQSVAVQMTNSDGTDFQALVYTVRLNRRLAFAVENPNAVVGGDLQLTAA
ncbi:MAG: phage major capsid protein [Succinivibrio sp.]|nr:phage major capsid protein [Succinivibrio sp.]